MFSNNQRFLGWLALFSGALILSSALPQATFSQEATAKSETSPETNERELRVELMEQQLVHAREELAEQRHAQIQEKKLQEQVAQLHEEKQKMVQALQEAHRDLQRRLQASMPPLEDTQTRVFHLKHINGNKLRDTIEDILGSDLLRLSADVSPQTLVIRAGEDSLARAEALIQKMDQASVVSATEEPSELPRSLMVRIFWLSQGQAFAGAQLAEEMLPESVIQALGQIGLEYPCVVLQSNTSISLGNDKDKAKFEVRDLPAIFFRERLLLNAKGEVNSTVENQIGLSIEASTERSAGNERIFESHVSGSIVAPLEHFVVLGTANFASLTPEEGTDFNTGLAFVVQVIESESFAPED